MGQGQSKDPVGDGLPDELTDDEMKKLQGMSTTPEQAAKTAGSGPADLLTGFTKRFGEGVVGIVNTAKGLGKFGMNLAQEGGSGVRGGPMPRTQQDIADFLLSTYGPMREQWNKAGEAAKGGRYAEAMNRGVAGSIPFFGPQAADLTEQISKEPWSGTGALLADLTQLGLGETAGKTLPAAGKALRESSLTSYGRALDPVGQVNKYTAPKAIKQLRDKNAIFWTRNQLDEWNKAEMGKALADRSKVETSKGADLSVPFGEIQKRFSNKGEREFTPITGTRSGIPISAFPEDTSQSLGVMNRNLKTMGGAGASLDELFEIYNKIKNDKSGSTIKIGGTDFAIDDPAIQNIMSNIDTPPSSGSSIALTPQDLLQLPVDIRMQIVEAFKANPNTPIPTEAINLLKGEWQKWNRAHGVYSGKKVYGSSPEFTPKVQANAASADVAKNLLNDVYGPDWTDANERYSIGKTIESQNEARKFADLGTSSPESRNILEGFGSQSLIGPGTKNILRGADIRGFRKLRESPGWQSTVGWLKDKFGIGLEGGGNAAVNLNRMGMTGRGMGPVPEEPPVDMSQPMQLPASNPTNRPAPKFIKTATDPNTGRKMGFNGEEWVPIDQ